MATRRVSVLFCCSLLGLLACTSETPSPGPPVRDDAARTAAPAGPEYVAVYASGNGNVLQPLFDAFEAETNVRVQLVTGDFSELRDKIDHPGSSPPADVVILRSFAELWTTAEDDVFRPGVSSDVAGRVADAYRDGESRWFALSMYPRVIAFNPERVAPADLAAVSDYAALADPVWRGKLCLSSSTVPGNRALLAFLIQQYGVREAELLVRGLKANTALAELDSDRDLVGAIAVGRCAIGIAAMNEVARARSLTGDIAVNVHAFDEVDNFLLDFSGAAISRHAANPDGAAALLAWLSLPSPNALQASLSFEFPVNGDAPVSASLRAFERVRTGSTTAVSLGFLLEDARLLAERARYR